MNNLVNISNNYVVAQQYPAADALVSIVGEQIEGVQLSLKEQMKIVQTYNAEMYDMAAEYVWMRTINVLREKLSVFGDDFIADMVGGNYFESVKDISEDSIIDLAADIGYINQAARIQFKQNSELLYYYQSKQARERDHEELRKAQAASIISSCIIYGLKADTEDNFIPYTNLRKELQTTIIVSGSAVLDNLNCSPYFYIRTITRTMLNLAGDNENPSIDIVLENMKIVLITVWEKLDDNDRWPIGIAYSQAVSAGNTMLTKALRSVLNTVKGFDYVPESTKSDAYRKTAKILLEKHKGFDNFYNESTAAKMLANMGTTIPKAALVDCLTAVLICKLGNNYGVSIAAQEYLDDILGSITTEKWAYFLNNMTTNDELLYELAHVDRGGEVLQIWMNVSCQYSFDKLLLNDKDINELIHGSVAYNSKKVKIIATRLYNAIYQKNN